MKIEPQAYYPGLDALRGIAILLVLGFHYFAFSPGWMGVDLFFVLSGFLITKNLLETRHKPGYFRRFFIRRMLRIFPLYFLVLTVFYAAAPFVFSQKEPGSVYAYYTQNRGWFYTFTQNWLFIKKGLPPEPYLQHFWSLAVEEQFYIFWPFLLYWVKDVLVLQRVLVALFFLALLTRFFFWFQRTGHETFYYHTLARVDSLSAGAFLSARLYLKKRFSVYEITLGFAAFAAALTASYFFYRNCKYDNAVFATAGYSCSALFFMMVCYLFARLPANFQGLRFLTFTGRISYGLYVYHLPVLLVTLFVLLTKPFGLLPSATRPVNQAVILSLVLTFSISYFSYRLFEQPFLKLKKKFTGFPQ